MTSKEISRRNFLEAAAIAGAGAFLPRTASVAKQEEALALLSQMPPLGEQGATLAPLPWTTPTLEGEPLSLRQAVDKLKQIITGSLELGEGEAENQTPPPEPKEPESLPELYPPVERFPLYFYSHSQIDRESAAQMEREVAPWLEAMFDVIRQADISELNKNVAAFREAMEKGRGSAGFDRFYLWANPTLLKKRVPEKEWNPFDFIPWVKSDNRIAFYCVIRPEFKKPYAASDIVFTPLCFNWNMENILWSMQLIAENTDAAGNYDGAYIRNQVMEVRNNEMNNQSMLKSLRLYPKLMATVLFKDHAGFRREYQRELGK